LALSRKGVHPHEGGKKKEEGEVKTNTQSRCRVGEREKRGLLSFDCVKKGKWAERCRFTGRKEKKGKKKGGEAGRPL